MVDDLSRVQKKKPLITKGFFVMSRRQAAAHLPQGG
jgi:hypothetical protein